MAPLTVHPVTPTIGAEIRGVRLDDELDEGTVAAVRQALLTHLVVFIRDQHPSPAQLKRFALSFGELDIPSHLKNLGGDVSEVHLVDYDGSLPRGSYADVWHSDVTFAAEPPLGSVLTPAQIPAEGGDTLWANMYAAYEALSPKMQTFLDGLVAEHAYPTGGTDATRNDAPPAGVAHPVVRVHPETGRKSLFVNAMFTRRILGIDVDQSQRVLDLIYRHCMAPEFQMRWRWQYGDVAFWDNRCTCHYGVVDYRERRVLHRITLKGDRPQGPASDV